MRDVCGQLLEEQGYITTLTNRRRRFSEWKGKSDAFLKMLAQKEAWPEERLEHEKRALWWQGWVAWNSLVQGSTADYVKVTMWKFWKEIKKRAETDPRWAGVLMMVQVHDEVLIEAPEEIAQEVGDTLIKVAETAMTLRVPVKMEIGMGKTWEDAK
jgi:DNA polymerase-1